MSRTIPDLNESLEWNLLGRRELKGTLVTDTVTTGTRIYSRTRWVIPAQSFFVEDSSIVAVGVRNPKASPRWFLGAWATMLLPVSPSSTTQFVSAMDADRRSCRLGILNLLVFPKLTPSWILEVKFPDWHEEILLEAWRYDGRDIEAPIEVSQLQEVASRIEAKIDQL